jgi:hypothetical protein
MGPESAGGPARHLHGRGHRFEGAGFDRFVEGLCRPHYADGVGRPGIPPGVYFRMLFIGYFEGLDSQRGIAWRCADSRSLQAFLGYLPSEATPDHSSLTKVRRRLPEVVHEQVFAFVLQIADAQGLLQGKTVAVDATTLEANAALKAIRRKDTGDDWKAYLKKLAAPTPCTGGRRWRQCRLTPPLPGAYTMTDTLKSLPTDNPPLGPLAYDGHRHELVSFADAGGRPCLLQQGYPGTLWLGRDRLLMHLDRGQVAALVERLRAWLDAGSFGRPDLPSAAGP